MANSVCRLLCAALMISGLASSPMIHAQPVDTAAVQPTVPDQVEAAFRYADFDELERLYAIYGKPGVRSPLTGTPRVKHFWMGINKVADSDLRVSEAYYLQMDALTRKWSVDHPQSVLAQLLYAQSLITHAWFYRGGGYANTVSPAAWESFGKYLGLALDQLGRSKSLAGNDTSWHRHVLTVGRGQGWELSQMQSVFEDGIAKNPEDEDLYFTIMTSMLPKWGGDLPTVERFIALVTQKTRDKLGMEMYARLYASLSNTEVKQSLFTATHASWPKMKAGFEDRLSRYPHTDHRNMYAYFACMAKDRAALQEQLELMGDAFERIFWGSSPEQTFDECKAMARQL